MSVNQAKVILERALSTTPSSRNLVEAIDQLIKEHVREALDALKREALEEERRAKR